LHDFHHAYIQARMRKIAAKSGVDLRGAVLEATNWPHDYCSQGVTTRELAWFRTTLLEKVWST
jgi:hypothetical protein